MAGKSLEDAVQEMINNVEAAAAQAAWHTCNQIKKDFEQAAKESVDKYYEYKNGYYTRHLRQYRLYDTYSVKTDYKKTKDKIKINGVITMDSDPLEGRYFSNSTLSGDHDDIFGPVRLSFTGKTPVDAEYVFNNFIHGIHPWTNGWPISGAKDLEYKEFQRRPTPNTLLSKYINSYGDKYFAKRFETNFIKLIKFYL